MGPFQKTGLGALDGLCVELLGLGADVHALAVVRNRIGRDNLGNSVLAKVIGNAIVDGEAGS